jgi:hypothetical protein
VISSIDWRHRKFCIIWAMHGNQQAELQHPVLLPCSVLPIDKLTWPWLIGQTRGQHNSGEVCGNHAGKTQSLRVW